MTYYIRYLNNDDFIAIYEVSDDFESYREVYSYWGNSSKPVDFNRDWVSDILITRVDMYDDIIGIDILTPRELKKELFMRTL